jgi:protein-S-isoprenylcysteine O-methyltransferase Ste14
MVLKQPSLLKHLRDIVILPFTVTCIIPYFIYKPNDYLLPESNFLKAVGTFSVFCGLSLFLYTVVLFNNIGKGTLAPWSPTQKLVVAGPYRYCRNPMITGVLFILIGEALAFHSTAILIEAVLFVVINTIYFIFSEEPGLQDRFGNDYKVYKQNVPRWIPRFKPYKH